MAHPKSFDLSPATRNLFQMAPWSLTAVALFLGVFAVLAGGEPSFDESRLRLVAGGVGFLFALGAGWSFRTARRLADFAISVDKEGLWPSARDRSTALVPWRDVVHLRERGILQRLELLDRSGQVLARLEYQLEGFSTLRSLVLERANLNPLPTVASGIYQKSWRYHARSLGLMLGLALLGGAFREEMPLLGHVGLALVIGLLARDYWKTPFRLHLTREGLEIDRPWRRQRIPRERITGIEVQERRHRHAKFSVVIVSLAKGHEPIRLAALGLSAIDLYRALRAWREGKAGLGGPSDVP